MLTYVGNAAETVSGTAVTLPTFKAGDLAIVFAFRDGSTTNPSLPAGWTNVATPDGTSCSARIGYRQLITTDTTTSVWTNATEIEVIVLRGHNGQNPIGGSAAAAAATNQINYASVTLTDTDVESWVVGFAASRDATDVSTPAVAGMTNRAPSVNTMGMHTGENVSSFASSNYDATVNTSGAWVAFAIEVRAGISALAKQTSGNTTPATSWVTATLDLPANKLGLIWVHNYRPGATATTPTISGWTQVATVLQGAANDRRVTLFRRLSGSDSSATHTIDFGGVTQDVSAWSVSTFDGTKITGTNGVDAIVQSGTATTGSGANVSSQTITLSTLASSRNGTAGGIAYGTLGAQSITPGTNYTELGEISDGAFGEESQYRYTGATTSVDWTTGGAVTLPLHSVACELAFLPGVTNATATPSTHTHAFTLNAVTASGTSNVTATPSANSRSFTLNTPSLVISSTATPTANLRSFTSNAVTANGTTPNATATPAAILCTFTRNAVVDAVTAKPTANLRTFTLNATKPDTTAAPTTNIRSFTLNAVTATGTSNATAHPAAVLGVFVINAVFLLPVPHSSITVEVTSSSVTASTFTSSITVTDTASHEDVTALPSSIEVSRIDSVLVG